MLRKYQNVVYKQQPKTQSICQVDICICKISVNKIFAFNCNSRRHPITDKSGSVIIALDL